MTPKEKAIELVERYSGITTQYEEGYGYSPNIENAKICALISVDEIINSIVITDLTTAENQFIYWQEVKQEIKKL